MKAVLALALLATMLVASVNGKATVAHRMERVAVEEQVATQTSESTNAAQVTATATNAPVGSVGCGCDNPTSTPVVTSGGGCGCQSGNNDNSGSFTSWRDSQIAALQAMGRRAKPEDVVKPIDEWLDNFNKKELIEGGLYDAARITVLPLMKKLRHTQDDAVERLKRSNREIRQQVESAAVDHVYNMLKTKSAIDDAQTIAIGKQEQIEDAQDDLNAAKAQLGSAKRAANDLKLTLMSEQKAAGNGTETWAAHRQNTTNTILSVIDKILAQ